MSEISKLQLKVLSLSNLKTAGRNCGFEMREQEHFKVYYKDSDANRCNHVLYIPGTERHAFEIGVIQQPDQSYTLAWDDMDSELVKRAGKGMKKLECEYEAVTYRELMVGQGYEMSEVLLPDGTRELYATKYE